MNHVKPLMVKLQLELIDILQSLQLQHPLFQLLFLFLSQFGIA